MGHGESVHADVGELLDAARRCDALAELVDGVVRQLDRLAFDGSVAGVAHAARGDAVRRAVDDIVDQVLEWARALREVGSALAASGRRYVEADVAAAARLE